MKAKSIASSTARALRLRTEARNCLTLAVGQRDSAFAGELIDEAIRLARRARELTGPPPPATGAKFR